MLAGNVWKALVPVPEEAVLSFSPWVELDPSPRSSPPRVEIADERIRTPQWFPVRTYMSVSRRTPN